MFQGSVTKESLQGACVFMCVAVCCSVLQCVDIYVAGLRDKRILRLAELGNLLPATYIPTHCNTLHTHTHTHVTVESRLFRELVYFSVLQCATVFCTSESLCILVCCSVLQCVAVCCKV